MAADSLSFKPLKHLDILRPADATDILLENTTVFYLRIHRATCEIMRMLLQEYQARLPADVAWAAVWLDQLASLPDHAEASLLYVGATMTGPLNRLNSDLSANIRTRFGNLSSVASPPQWVVYQFCDLFVPTLYTNLVTNVLRNSVESMMIAALGYHSVNSAHGGSYVESLLVDNNFQLFKTLIYVENHGPVELGEKHVLELLLINSFLALPANRQSKNKTLKLIYQTTSFNG
ncbi:hypothetical protein Unana1_05669 [Umbelopsis nana]